MNGVVRNCRRFFAVAGAGLLLGGCVSTLPEVKSLSDLNANEILLVGKVELIPRLETVEQQNLHGIGSGKLKNRIALGFAAQKPKYKDKYTGTTYKQMDGYVSAEPGTTFFVRYPKGKPVYYLGGEIYLEVGSGGAAGIKIPGGLKYVPGKKARALYLGTIRYYRDDYNAITKVRLINQVSAAKRDMQKKFGRRIPIQVVKPAVFEARAFEY
jgi:hypothetical protein